MRKVYPETPKDQPAASKRELHQFPQNIDTEEEKQEEVSEGAVSQMAGGSIGIGTGGGIGIGIGIGSGQGSRERDDLSLGEDSSDAREYLQ